MQKIQIIRSRRKTIAVEIKRDLSIIVRAPIGMSQERINKFIQEKSNCIEKHFEIVKERNLKVEQNFQDKLSDNEIKILKKRAKDIISNKTIEISKIIGVSYNKISLRFQKSRWGSCSAKGNLNFNCLLALCPEEVIDYVIIHELCHLKCMNHSKEFWIIVSKFCSDYKRHKKWLKDNGYGLISKLK